MEQLRWDHLDVEMVGEWSALMDAIAEADQHEETYGPEDLAEELGFTGFDARAHSVTVWDGDRLVAYTQVHGRDDVRFDGLSQVSFDIGIRPQWRERGLEHLLLARCEDIGRALSQERTPGIDYVMRVDFRGNNPSLLREFETNGYERARVFHEMQRPAGVLAGTVAEGALSMQGVTIRPVVLADGEALRNAHNDAFRQHWGSGPRGVDEWRELMESRTTRLSASRIAVNEDGLILAYAFVSQWLEGELYILLVGTRPEYQRRGLAHAVLAEVLRAADDDPAVDRVSLDVDSDSPTDAGSIYTDCGFVAVRTMDVYQKCEQAGEVSAFCPQ